MMKTEHKAQTVNIVDAICDLCQQKADLYRAVDTLQPVLGLGMQSGLKQGINKLMCERIEALAFFFGRDAEDLKRTFDDRFWAAEEAKAASGGQQGGDPR